MSMIFKLKPNESFPHYYDFERLLDDLQEYPFYAEKNRHPEQPILGWLAVPGSSGHCIILSNPAFPWRLNAISEFTPLRDIEISL